MLIYLHDWVGEVLFLKLITAKIKFKTEKYELPAK